MSLQEADLVRRLHCAREVARRAGKILLAHFGHLHGYDEKSPANLVTIADRESEAYLTAEIARRFPDDAILGEESDGVEGAMRRRPELESTEFAWCVDPLDGTTSFVHAYPVFGVSIGILFRGRPVMGVVYAPARDELFVGGQSVPATRNGAPISVSKVSALDGALVATGFHYDRRDRLDALLAPAGRVLECAHDLRRAGAAALDLCDVACGRVEAFFELGLSPWVVAAAHAIVEAAGGQLSRYDGAAHDLFGQQTVASNGKIHRELLETLEAPKGAE